MDINKLKAEYDREFKNPNIVYITAKEMYEITGCWITAGFRVGNTWYEAKHDPNAEKVEH